MSLGESLINNIIARFILLHIGVCGLALCAVICLPAQLFPYVGTVRSTGKLAKGAEIIEAPLSQYELPKFDSRIGRYKAYVNSGGDLHLVYSDINPIHYDAMKAYVLKGEGKRGQSEDRLVAVPSDPTWKNIFSAVNGRSFEAETFRLVGYVIMTVFLVWLAIAGYLRIRIKRSGAFRI